MYRYKFETERAQSLNGGPVGTIIGPLCVHSALCSGCEGKRWFCLLGAPGHCLETSSVVTAGRRGVGEAAKCPSMDTTAPHSTQ